MVSSLLLRSNRYAAILALLGLPGIALPAAEAPRVGALGGQLFVNHGLVGVGRMPAGQRDRFGETFGSFSAFTFQPGSWRRESDGSYRGVLFTQPDRGYNGAGTTNYVPRFNKVEVTFRPAPGGSTAQNQVALQLVDTVRFTESSGTPFTSLDPVSAGTGSRAGLPPLPQAFNGRLSLDAEGIVVNADGSVWVSDEYGPYVYKFSADGRLSGVIRPPEALVPKRAGADSFASNNPGAGQPAPVPADPVTGRQNNQGLEGLSLSPDGRTLFTLLQSAARQDGGTGASGPRRHTRLLAYDVTGAEPRLKGHYVVALPTFLVGSATRVAAQSEILALNNHQILVLARDGNGRGLANTVSAYRSVQVHDISTASNLVGTPYESATTPVAPGGNLVAGVVAATSQVIVDLNDPAQLAKFGLNNGPVDSVNTLSEKWEALALVPAHDPFAPDDWFLFVGNDNDFITTNGFQDGTAYTEKFDNDTMVLVYRLTLPSRLANSSSRAVVSGSDGFHIHGFVVSGARPRTMLIRAVGPTLANYGVAGSAADPQLVVHDRAGMKVDGNDNWTDAGAAVVREAGARAGAFPLVEGSRDAAVVVNLDPGAYTVVVNAAGQGGVVLTEVYELP
ncbi:MAG: hypothetical protein RIR76_1399 [Verrucomicrobiota bacterium]|jgi:hypothetical protein